jgi:hypothetical protein
MVRGYSNFFHDARRGLTVERLALCNSGDTAGLRDSVVGYGAWTFASSAL